jgi:hypothetical protein
MWGADVAQLRMLAQQFGKTAQLLLQHSAQLSSHINNTPSWRGEDAEHFRSDWNSSHRMLLQQTASRLKQESKLLLKNADEQDQASKHGGPGGSGPGGSGSGGSGGSGDDPTGPDWLADVDVPSAMAGTSTA